MRRPLIAYIEPGNDHLGNINITHSALVYCLKNECGCDVSLYRYFLYFQSDLVNLVRDFKAGILSMIIIKQDKYDSEHQELINFVRKNISSNIPIIVIKDWGAENEYNGDINDELIYTYYHSDKELLNLVKKTLINWQAPNNWLGPESKEDEALLLLRLEEAYKINHPDEDDGVLGFSGYNDQIVTQALRVSCVPSVFLREELNEVDFSINDVYLKMLDVKISLDFDNDFSKIDKMSDVERESFLEQLSFAAGYVDGYRIRETLGNSIKGFAIDPVTLETEITNRYGMHSYAKKHLSYRVANIEKLQKGEYSDEDVCFWRLVSGYIYEKIPGFKTPILKLILDDTRASEDQLQRIIDYLMRIKKFIPITWQGRIIK